MLTIPEPRSIPYPKPIPKIGKPIAVPKSLYVNQTEQGIEAAKAKMKDQVMASRKSPQQTTRLAYLSK